MYTASHLLVAALTAHSNVVKRAFDAEMRGLDSCLHWWHATELLSISRYLNEKNSVSDYILELITDIIDCIDSDSLNTVYNLALIDSNFLIPNLGSGGGASNVLVRAKPGEANIVVDDLSTEESSIFEISSQHEGAPLSDKLTEIDTTISSLGDLYLSKNDTITEEVTSNGVGTVGGVNDGYTFPIGMSFQEFLNKVFVKANAAIYNQSTASISDNISNTVEVGQTFTPTLTISYIQRDSGAATESRFFRAGVLIHTDNSVPFNHTASSEDLPSDGSSLSYSGQVDHLQGAQKYDNLGNPSGDPSVLVPARTNLSAGSVSVVARRKIFYSKNRTNISTSSDIRGMTWNQWSTDNTFSVNVIPGDTSVEFAIPGNKNISSVTFVGALVNDETGNFTPTETTVSVEGAENKYPTNYKVYQYIPSVPFGSSARYDIILN